MARLLGPLPADAVPRHQPVASPEVLASPTGWAVAGWEQLVLYLSAGTAGSRVILVILDGSFRGTRWHSVTAERGGEVELERELTPSEPSPDDVSGLRVVVAEMIRRRPST